MTIILYLSPWIFSYSFSRSPLKHKLYFTSIGIFSFDSPKVQPNISSYKSKAFAFNYCVWCGLQEPILKLKKSQFFFLCALTILILKFILSMSLTKKKVTYKKEQKGKLSRLIFQNNIFDTTLFYQYLHTSHLFQKA